MLLCHVAAVQYVEIRNHHWYDWPMGKHAQLVKASLCLVQVKLLLLLLPLIQAAAALHAVLCTSDVLLSI